MSEGYNEFWLLQRLEGVSGGRVCLGGSGIMVEFLADLFAAGESIDYIAGQYNRSREDIEAAIRIVVRARGTNLLEKKALRIVERHIPLQLDLSVPRQTTTGQRLHSTTITTTTCESVTHTATLMVGINERDSG